MSRIASRLFLAFAACLIATRAGAQVNPSGHWQTIRTEHFYVSFTPATEEIARRAAVSAESAYVKLSQHLHPPRGMIDIVVADNVDYSNGAASPFPSNRILIYANPPVNESALRFTDDPTDLVVTHELTHIFQLDRVGGIWRPLQKIFGRQPLLFPNARLAGGSSHSGMICRPLDSTKARIELSPCCFAR